MELYFEKVRKKVVCYQPLSFEFDEPRWNIRYLPARP